MKVFQFLVFIISGIIIYYIFLGINMFLFLESGKEQGSKLILPFFILIHIFAYIIPTYMNVNKNNGIILYKKQIIILFSSIFFLIAGSAILFFL